MTTLLRPTRRLVGLFALGVLPALFIPYGAFWARLTLSLDALVLMLTALDFWLMRKEHLDITHTAPERISRDAPFDWVVNIANRTQRARRLHLTWRHPQGLSDRTGSHTALCQAGETQAHTVQLVANKRGTYALMAPVVEHVTPLGLGVVTSWPSAVHTVEALPSTRELGRFDALVRQHKLHLMGVSRARQRGHGNEIAGLRPYALGDPWARIDWKATARRGTPISREMHAERRQTLVIMLDCGRRMAREVNGRSRLDDAVEAALLLGHAALHSDDKVGLAAFSNALISVVPPVRGHSGVGALARAMFDLRPVLHEPAYETMLERVDAKFPKRSLLVLFTDAVEPESLQALAKPLQFLSQRHLVLCVTFRDASIEHALGAAGDNTESFFRAGAAADVWLERERHLALLRQTGAMVLEVEPSALSTEVINRYLEIKARRLL